MHCHIYEGSNAAAADSTATPLTLLLQKLLHQVRLVIASSLQRHTSGVLALRRVPTICKLGSHLLRIVAPPGRALFGCGQSACACMHC